MNSHMIVFLLSVCLNSFLFQQADCVAPKVSQCSWYSNLNGDDTDGYCYLNVGFPLTVPQEPSTYQNKAITRIYAQNFLCNQHTDTSTCSADKANQCTYESDYNVCNSQIYNAWKDFESDTSLDLAPTYFQCPGSKAYYFVTCSSLGGKGESACVYNTKCAYNSTEGTCTSAYYQSLDARASLEFDEKYRAYSTVIDGDCEGVCMLKQELVCPSITSEAPCIQKPLCAWSSGYCQSKIFGNDAWANAIYKASKACAAIGSEKACSALNKDALTVNSTRVQLYQQYPLAGGRAPKSCFNT